MTEATRVVPTLASILSEHTNTVWCASFHAAWKALEEWANGPVGVEGAEQLSHLLNNASDPRTYIPNETLLTAAGLANQEFASRINAEMKQKFPNKEIPSFPLDPLTLILYSYMEENLIFGIPYNRNSIPFIFSDSRGNKTSVNSFKMERPKTEGARLPYQPRILHLQKKEDESEVLECVVDLDGGSKPNQIILALVEPQNTLADTLALVQKKIDSAAPAGKLDLLIVPDILCDISHRFKELEGRHLKSARPLQEIKYAQQDIFFRLNKSGAQLKSQAKKYVTMYSISAPTMPTHFLFNRPFLVYMKNRDAKEPYFAMWIDNADLLKPWNESGDDFLNVSNGRMDFKNYNLSLGLPNKNWQLNPSMSEDTDQLETFGFTRKTPFINFEGTEYYPAVRVSFWNAEGFDASVPRETQFANYVLPYQTSMRADGSIKHRLWVREDLGCELDVPMICSIFSAAEGDHFVCFQFYAILGHAGVQIHMMVDESVLEETKFEFLQLLRTLKSIS